MRLSRFRAPYRSYRPYRCYRSYRSNCTDRTDQTDCKGRADRTDRTDPTDPTDPTDMLCDKHILSVDKPTFTLATKIFQFATKFPKLVAKFSQFRALICVNELSFIGMSSWSHSCSLTRTITSHSMKNLAFRSLLRWRWFHYQFALPRLYVSFWKGWENVLFELGSGRVTGDDSQQQYIYGGDVNCNPSAIFE